MNRQRLHRRGLGRGAALVTAAAALSAAPDAAALELGEGDGLTSVEVHAFASQGFIASKYNNYLADDTTHGSFQFSEVGINFTKTLTKDLRMGLQLFAQDLGPTGNYTPKVDWFYLDYRWKDWLGFRAGRVKIPFGLYNEINDVDSARVPILLPQSVYPIENVNYLLAQTGGELYGYVKLGDAGALDYGIYGGTILVDTLVPPDSPYQVQDLNVPYVAGGRLLWETPLDGLRVGGTVQSLRLDATFLTQGQAAKIRLPVNLWVASAEYVVHDLTLAAEYSRWYASDTSDNPMVFPSTPTITSERAYAMASYRASSWFSPGAYYAITFPNVDKRKGRENFQHDVATTLRFDINSHWLVKLEGHFMSGTAGLTPTLNDDVPLAKLPENWGVLLVKTTAYF